LKIKIDEKEGTTMQEKIVISTSTREELVDITEEVKKIIQQCGLESGIAALYAQGATGALMIQENWDDSVQTDVIHFLRTLIPQGIWQHDRQDGNGDAHLKAGLVGPSEIIPIINGQLGLSQWQNIFFCEFDGPRSKRSIVCTIIAD
jgi:secondary thiamine-phosphate synthase enzyme